MKKKEVILLGDYNINLLNCDSDKYTCEFLELMLSFSFLPRIVKPTLITSRSQTLIGNIFLNEPQSNIIAGNITTDISDHLTQFVAIPDIWHNPEIPNEEIYKKNYKKLNSDDFKNEFNNINWTNLFSDKNVDETYDSFLEETEKRKLKEQIKKPWITNDLTKRIKYKNKLHKKSKIEKDFKLRNEFSNEHKILQKSLRKEIQLEKIEIINNFLKTTKII